MAVRVIKLLCLLESKNIILLTKAYHSEKCKGELPISSHSSTEDQRPSPFQMSVVCIYASSCRKLVLYILTTQMKLPSNKTPCVSSRQADRHALPIKSCLAAFQEKLISRLFFFFFFNKCVLSCIQINLSRTSSLLPRCSHACLSCSQRVRRNSYIHII